MACLIITHICVEGKRRVWLTWLYSATIDVFYWAQIIHMIHFLPGTEAIRHHSEQTFVYRGR